MADTQYEVLYRKYRPKIFDDVVGQGSITRTLANEVMSGRTANAYLFTGSRGTGKTTCARILAKAVNCLDPQNGSPCCKCEICRGIEDGSIFDVEEIDAASNNGVNDARELIERIGFPPMRGRKRVFIIDEVHMLTTQAFNALLKSIEEPPENVMFILATTEVHKVLDTIKSRCQRFDFRRIAAADIAGRLEFIASREGAQISRETALYIARVADGGMRDAISVLDRSISISANVTDAVVTAAAGLVDRKYLFELADDFAAGNVQAVLGAVDRLHAGACDTERLISELMMHFRNLLIAKSMKSPGDVLACSDIDLAEYMRQSALFTVERILDINNILRGVASDMKFSSNKRVDAEIAMMKICSPAKSTDVSSLFARVAELERRISAVASSEFGVRNSESGGGSEQAASREKEPVVQTGPAAANAGSGMRNAGSDGGSEQAVIEEKTPEVQTSPAVQTDPLAGLEFEDDSADYSGEDEPVFDEVPPEVNSGFTDPPFEMDAEPVFDEIPAEGSSELRTPDSELPEPVFDEVPAEENSGFAALPFEVDSEPVFDDVPAEGNSELRTPDSELSEPVFDEVPAEESSGFADPPFETDGEPVFDAVPADDNSESRIPNSEFPQAPSQQYGPAYEPVPASGGVSRQQWDQAVDMITGTCPGFAANLRQGADIRLEGNVLHITGYTKLLKGILNMTIGKEGAQALKFAVDQVTGTNIDIRFD